MSAVLGGCLKEHHQGFPIMRLISIPPIEPNYCKISVLGHFSSVSEGMSETPNCEPDRWPLVSR